MNDRDDFVRMPYNKILLQENFQEIGYIVSFRDAEDAVRFDLIREIQKVDLMAVLQILKQVEDKVTELEKEIGRPCPVEITEKKSSS